jgi:U3 small nucleolar RNA-associated protein 14
LLFIPKGKKAAAKQLQRRGVHFAQVDLNEEDDSRSEISRRSTNTDEDEEMEDGDSDEFIDVLAVFDGKGQADDGSDSERPVKQNDHGHQRALQTDVEHANEDANDYNEDDDSGDEESEEDAIIVSASEGEEDPSPEALASLETFISTLDPSKKRKAPPDNDGPPADADAPPQTRKRRMIKERTEAGLENEFGAQGSGESFVCPPILVLLYNHQSSFLQVLRN